MMRTNNYEATHHIVRCVEQQPHQRVVRVFVVAPAAQHNDKSAEAKDRDRS